MKKVSINSFETYFKYTTYSIWSEIGIFDKWMILRNLFNINKLGVVYKV